MIALKLRQVDGALALVLPDEARVRLGVEQGDTVFLTEAPEGYALTSGSEASAETEAQLVEARRIMERRRAALRELAK